MIKNTHIEKYISQDKYDWLIMWLDKCTACTITGELHIILKKFSDEDSLVLRVKTDPVRIDHLTSNREGGR